jgi:hypothetical protein
MSRLMILNFFQEFIRLVIKDIWMTECQLCLID